MKIGFFDSGLGGLVIMRAVSRALPQYSYEYYGDTANLPYGDKTEERIYQLTQMGIEHLFARGCQLVVIACNTASAETLRRLQDEYLPQSQYTDRRILGVIIPVVEEVVASELKRVLLLATKRTVSSGKYHLELGKRNMIATKIESEATPELVPLIEAGDIETAIETAQKHIDAREGSIDGVILGCTHYTLLKTALEQVYPALRFFSQADIIPEKIKTYLEAHSEIEQMLDRAGERNIYLTENRDDYDPIIEKFLRAA